jgi:hemoglobin
MSASGTTRVGLAALAFAVVAVVIVLLWRSRGDGSGERTATGAAGGAEVNSARVQNHDGARGGGQTRQPRDLETNLPPPPGDGSLHDRLGGRPGIRVLTGNLLDVVKDDEAIMANENIRAAAPQINVRLLHDHLVDFVCKEAGGPCEYTGGSITDIVAPLKITAAEWDAVEKKFAALLPEMKVPEREAQELMAVLGALEPDVVTAE